MVKKLLLPLLCLCFLTACAASAPDEDPGVQDIEPGQKSIIEPPSQSQNSGPQIEERNI